MRVLVTGITGFVGRHLAPRLAEAGHELAGLGLRDTAGTPPRVGVPDIPIHELDLADGTGLDVLLDSFRPEAVVHLAAQSAPSLALEDPVATFRANVEGTLRLLEALRRRDLRPRLLFVSSSEVYGLSNGVPITEGQATAPVNPYGASKAAGEILVAQYTRTSGLESLVVRSFPHAGAGQRPLFALPAFARQLARIEAGKQPARLSVGNLEARRDYLDVRDVVEAYARLLERGQPGETYNLCSGEVHSIGEGLELLIELSGCEVEVVTEPDLLRPLDQPLLRGDCAKLQKTTGWTPQISFPAMVAGVLDDWRGRVSRGEDL